MHGISKEGGEVHRQPLERMRWLKAGREGLFITGHSLSYTWDISSRLIRDQGLIMDAGIYQ